MFAAVMLLAIGADPTPAEIEIEKAKAAVAVALAKLKLDAAVPPPPPKATQGQPEDPYEFDNFSDFKVGVRAGGRGVLVVGIPDRFTGTYTVHCRVPSGFNGLADGEWDYWMEKGQMWVRERPKEVKKEVKPVAAAPFVGSPTMAGTTARSAATSLPHVQVPGSFEASRLTAPTRTSARIAPLFGSTNCPPSG